MNVHRQSVSARFRFGTLTSTPYDSDKVTVRDLMGCVHCGYMWVAQPGSGKVRGFCTRCSGYLCGRKCCREAAECVPTELLLTNMEAGMTFDEALRHRPIVVSTAGLLLPRG